MERGTRKFICGGYNNKNGCTERIVIHEDFILELITNRFNRELSDGELEEIIEYIEIEDKRLMEIHFSDNSKPILLKGNFIQF